jgi:hypothetical protein
MYTKRYKCECLDDTAYGIFYDTVDKTRTYYINSCCGGGCCAAYGIIYCPYCGKKLPEK